MILFIFFFLFGAVVGSFLNVCIYRMPRDLSIILPSSRCPSCQSPIRAWDNIPVVSFLLLGGKCRSCGARISLRYPAVEMLNGLLYVVVLWRYGFGWDTLIYCMLVSSLIVITGVDLEFQIIPDRITLPGTVIGLVAGSLLLPDPFSRSLPLGLKSSFIGFLAGGGFYYMIAVLSRGGMGGGDIKMMAMVGGLMGWKAVLLTTFVGSLTGSFVGIFLMVYRGKGRKAKIPFGPFLAFGTLISLFFGQELFRWYLY